VKKITKNNETVNNFSHKRKRATNEKWVKKVEAATYDF